MGRYILGLDAGNTVIKAIIFDMAGRELALAALDGRSSQPKPGHVERDLGELWRNAVTVIKQPTVDVAKRSRHWDACPANPRCNPVRYARPRREITQRIAQPLMVGRGKAFVLRQRRIGRQRVAQRLKSVSALCSIGAGAIASSPSAACSAA